MAECLHLLVHVVTTVNYSLHDVLRQVEIYMYVCMYVCVCVCVCIESKVHSITCNEGPDEEQRYSSTLSLTSALGVDG